jgi:hypothetical protein
MLQAKFSVGTLGRRVGGIEILAHRPKLSTKGTHAVDLNWVGAFTLAKMVSASPRLRAE